MNRIAAQRIIAGSRGNSSVGRARPCQGRGREFESRFPLQVFETPAMPGSVVSGPRKAAPVGTSPRKRGRAVPVTGQVAEWSCSGLQIRVRRFDSDPGLTMRSVPLRGKRFSGSGLPISPVLLENADANAVATHQAGWGLSRPLSRPGRSLAVRGAHRNMAQPSHWRPSHCPPAGACCA